METLTRHFNAEIRVSYRYFLPVLAYVGITFSFLAESKPDASYWHRFDIIGVLLFTAVVLAWLIGRWMPRVGQIATIVLLVCILYTGYMWTANPLLLALFMLPTALSAAIINLRACMLTAAGCSLTLLMLTPNLDTLSTILLLVGLWSIVGVLSIVYQPIYRLSAWFWTFYQFTANTLEESRSQKAELRQTLADLEQANISLTRLNRLAQGLRRSAEEARAAKAEFVANVSHELRTPLNMITGFAELLLQSPTLYGMRPPSSLLADLAVIHRNAEHLSKLIDDVLDLSQLEADQMALTKETIRMEDLIHSSVLAVRPLYESKGLYLKTEIAPNLPDVFCDQTRIREVLLNLLSNAGRFIEHGGTTIRAWEEHGMLHVAVADTGPGIAAEDIPKLFKPFQQVDGSIRRRHGGTGLGLSISRHFIEQHEGSIRVESMLGVGATFSFEIPVVPLAVITEAWRGIIPDWEYVGRSQPSSAPRPQVRPRIVLLDSENILYRLLSRYWGDAEIIPAQNPAEAAEYLAHTPAQALVINDISMRNTNSMPPSHSLDYEAPIFICSVPGVSQVLAELGVADRLIKPISRESLFDALSGLGAEQGTILIVDDEPDALHLFSRMLTTTEQRYKILMARNGLEAIQILQEHRPDVILLDLVMPHMDGFEFLEKRKMQPDWLAIPIILISSRDANDHPIVSRSLTVMLNSGLSLSQLLTSVRVLSKILVPGAQIDDRVRPTTDPDSPIYE